MNEIIKNKNKLIDPFGRTVDYLRVSVTDRCDFRCTYCMAEDMQFLPKKEILSLEEIEDICRVFMKLGTRKIRLTGGEPLVRKGIMQVIDNLGKEVGNSLDELTITTNGSQLETKAEELYNAGVRRINVSLDHLDPKKFKEITRWGNLEKVKRGLKKANEVGLKVKINTVKIDAQMSILVDTLKKMQVQLNILQTDNKTLTAENTAIMKKLDDIQQDILLT